MLLPYGFSNSFLATFSSLIKLPSMKFCMFLFLLNAIVGLLTNTLWSSGLICRMCQLFLTASDMSGSVPFYVNTSGIFFLLLIFSLFFKSSFVQLSQTCLFKLTSLYFFPKVFFFLTAQYLWYSSSVEHIIFNLNVWLNVILFLMQ